MLTHPLIDVSTVVPAVLALRSVSSASAARRR